MGLDASTHPPPTPTPYPGLHQLRPLARLGQECHTGARGAFPRLGLRGQWSRPRGQSWRERDFLPQGGGGGRQGGRSLPASHATPACRCYRECQGCAGRRKVCPGEVGEERWTGHWEQQEAWDRGHQLPGSVTCGGAPGHVPLWALLLHLQPKRLHEMVHLTAFTEHLLSAGSWPPSLPFRADICVGKTDGKGLQ